MTNSDQEQQSCFSTQDCQEDEDEDERSDKENTDADEIECEDEAELLRQSAAIQRALCRLRKNKVKNNEEDVDGGVNMKGRSKRATKRQRTLKNVRRCLNRRDNQLKLLMRRHNKIGRRLLVKMEYLIGDYRKNAVARIMLDQVS